MRDITSPLDGFASPFGRVALSLDPDAATYIAAVEAADGQALEQGVRNAYDDFVAGCKSDGIWDAIKASCILAGARTLSGALVSLKGTAPTNYNFVSGDYDRKTGLKGDGATKYLDSNRANNADPQDNKHLAVFASSAESRLSLQNAWYIRDAGATSGRSVLGVSGISAERFLLSINSQNTFNLTGARDVGLVAASRFSATQITYRLSGVNATIDENSEAPTSVNLGVFCRGDGDSGHTDARFSFYSIGESLDLAALDARVSALMTAIDGALP